MSTETTIRKGKRANKAPYIKSDAQVSSALLARREAEVKSGMLVELTELRKDKARLDWLETLTAPSISQFGDHYWQIWNEGKRYHAPFLRSAIDAAIAKTESW